MSGLTLGEEYNEHILSIHSAYIEHTLQARGRNVEGTIIRQEWLIHKKRMWRVRNDAPLF